MTWRSLASISGSSRRSKLLRESRRYAATDEIKRYEVPATQQRADQVRWEKRLGLFHMTIANQLHNSKFHKDGFDQNCPKCVKEGGVKEIIIHLKKCAAQNETDGDKSAVAIAGEQRRMIGILGLYVKVYAERMGA